jgi:uncharacterized membrane protein
MSDRALRFLIAALALAGAAISGYLTYTRYADASIFCTTGGCETVQSSRYAEVAGVPVAVLGLAGYVLIFLTTLGHGEVARVTGVSLALTGFFFSAYLVYVQLALIGAICQWCVASDVVMTAIAGLALLRLAPYALRRQVGSQT